MTLQLKEKLKKREQQGNLRQLHVSQSLIDFTSNDYLGLARSSKLAEAIAQELSACKNSMNRSGSTGSRLLTGNSNYAEELEAKIAEFHGFESGVLFNCGYMANLGLLSAIADDEDCIFFDSQIHASTRDGISLSKAKAFAFRHNDLLHLENRLKNCPAKVNRFICIESIYSTDGSMAPLEDICRMAKKYEAHLIVDEAHAAGVCGFQGRGLVAQFNLCSSVFAQITTFGKALGVHGAIVLGGQILKQSLINFATPYIYTTALPLPSLIAINCSYNMLTEMDNERKHLQTLIQLYGDAIPNASQTQIQSVSIKGNRAAKKLVEITAMAGFDVRALLSPTVQRGNELLRICLHAFNTENELKALIHIINKGAQNERIHRRGYRHRCGQNCGCGYHYNFPAR